MAAPVSKPAGEPVFARPSNREVPSTGPRLAWTGWLGWLACGAAVVAYVVGAAVGRTSFYGLVVTIAAIVAAYPWFRRIGRRFPDLEIEGLLRLSLGVKFLATIPRFEARQDSIDYHRAGATLADHFRSFDFAVDPGRSVPGTGSVRYLTGLVEVVTLENEFATFVVFSLMGFCGLVLFIQAFAIALPTIDPKRYVLLLLFWPSLVYWPSSIGKDAVMVLALSAVALGVAHLLRGGLIGVAWATPGLVMAALVRPHVALIAVTAAIATVILRSPKGGGTGFVMRIGLIGALLFGGALASDAVEAVFEIDGLNPSGLSAALDLANSRSAQGGSSFVAARIDGVMDFPWGFLTVLLRPFPHEANSVPMLLTGVEGLVLAILLITAIPRVMAAVGRVREEAYIAYAGAFTVVFVYLFSALGNFGILARQRSMTLPLVLVIVALPTARERVRRRRLMESS